MRFARDGRARPRGLRGGAGRGRSTPAARELVVLAGFMRVLSAGFVRALRRAACSTSIPRCCRATRASTRMRARWLPATREHGASVHFVTAELDGGPADAAGGAYRCCPATTSASLSARVHALEHIIYPDGDRMAGHAAGCSGTAAAPMLDGKAAGARRSANRCRMPASLLSPCWRWLCAGRRSRGRRPAELQALSRQLHHCRGTA